MYSNSHIYEFKDIPLKTLLLGHVSDALLFLIYQVLAEMARHLLVLLEFFANNDKLSNKITSYIGK